MNKKSILLVVSHPDDEVLGAGATIHKLSSLGIEVNCSILSGAVEARSTKYTKEEILENIKTSGNIIGINNHTIGNFDNIKFNNYPHLEIVQFIENSIKKYQPTTILTHHMSDINDDHLITSKACMAASRLYQRQDNKFALHNLLTMEIPSSTDWSYPSSNPYQPNFYCHIDKNNLKKKLDALEAYGDVLRPEPHPRSLAALNSLAIIRGSECGHGLAESFHLLYGILNDCI
tara:strand:+ start:199 stop:894 length:696 start_codon:yes stop_codon:yes gene_type:complete